MQKEKSENLWKHIGETEQVKIAGSDNVQEVWAKEFENEHGENFMNVQGEKYGNCVKYVNKQNDVANSFWGGEIEPVHADESTNAQADEPANLRNNGPKNVYDEMSTNLQNEESAKEAEMMQETVLSPEHLLFLRHLRGGANNAERQLPRNDCIYNYKAGKKHLFINWIID